MNRCLTLGLLLASLLGLALRCRDLSLRVMHNDEAVNAFKLQSLMKAGNYRYDPNEHHGPTLYYSAWLWARVTGVPDPNGLSSGRLRALTVCFGIALIFLLPLVADGLGKAATIWSGLLIAVSPAMVYYSRDFIHELLLVFFTFLALASFWRYYRTAKIHWAICCGAGIGLMQSTKETFILSMGAAGVATLLNQLWTPSCELFRRDRHQLIKALGLGLVAWSAVAVLFFSSFFTNFGGILDSIRTYLPWMHRAAGHSPHVHPWLFYLSRLAWFHTRNGPIWSEAFIMVLACVGMFVAFSPNPMAGTKPNFLRFLTFYTLALTVIYCSIAYKTPWCLLGFWHGFILLAGVGVSALWFHAKKWWLRIGLVVLLVTGIGQLARQSSIANGKYAADPRNPYVYAQTSPDVLELTDKILAIARTTPQQSHLFMKVCVPGNDYWPLPWYLRSCDQIGWFSEIPEEMPAPIMIVATAFSSKLDQINGYQAAGVFELRPGVFLALYVEQTLWLGYLSSKPLDK